MTAETSNARGEVVAWMCWHPEVNDGRAMAMEREPAAGAKAVGWQCRPLTYADATPPPPADAEVQYSPQFGEPPAWFDEWFIAQTHGGERVVLRRLPKEWTYDYTTADGTYFKADRIRWWMQFPDSQFKPMEAALSQQPEARGVVDDAMVFRLAVWMAKNEGHDDPHHLIWEGSPPEPWGEVWNRYEDDARAALTAALTEARNVR